MTARDKQLAALDALGQIEVDVAENRMTAPESFQASVQARQTLADAPHSWECSSLFYEMDQSEFGPCTCWKSGLQATP